MYWHTYAEFLAYKIILRCKKNFSKLFLKKLYLIYARDSLIEKKSNVTVSKIGQAVLWLMESKS